MAEYFEPVSFERHGRLRWSYAKDFRFAADLAAVPLTAKEILKSSHHYRICLAPLGSRLRPVALLAERGGNQYLRPDGSWSADYIPLVLRSFPLRLIRAAGSEGLILAAAADSNTIREDEGCPFYSGPAALSQETSSVVAQLLNAVEDDTRVFAAFARLRSAGLLEPVPAAGFGGTGRTRTPLLRVSAQALAKLDPAALAELYAQGPEAAEAAVAICFSWAMPLVWRSAEPSPPAGMIARKTTPAASNELQGLLDLDEKIWF